MSDNKLVKTITDSAVLMGLAAGVGSKATGSRGDDCYPKSTAKVLLMFLIGLATLDLVSTILGA